MTKEELEKRVLEMEDENRSLKVAKIFLEKETKDLVKSVTILGKTCHEIYKCYPYILGECCTEPELIKLFKVQDAFHNFLKKLNDLKNDRKENEDEF